MTPTEHAYWSRRDRTATRRQSGVPDADAAPTGPLVSDPSQLIEVVALGQADALIPQSLAEANPRTDIAYRPVTDATPYAIAIAWFEGHAGSTSRSSSTPRPASTSPRASPAELPCSGRLRGVEYPDGVLIAYRS